MARKKSESSDDTRKPDAASNPGPAAGPPKRPRGRPPKPEGAPNLPSRHLDYSVVSLKCTGDFRRWLERLADSQRMPITTLVERSITEWAKSLEFAEKPPRRIEPRMPRPPGSLD